MAPASGTKPLFERNLRNGAKRQLNDSADVLQTRGLARLRSAIHLVFCLGQHWELSRAMTGAGLPAKREFYKDMRYRYLRRFYLGGGLPMPQRLRVAIHHYRCIARHFRRDFLAVSAAAGYVLWHRDSGDCTMKIVLRYPYVYNFDADLCLVLEVDGNDVCIISFSIAPGAVVGAPQAEVLLIAGIQGIAGRIDEIRLATQACNNVSPAHALLLAAEAMAGVIGVTAMVGIGHGARAHPAAGGERSQFDYDAFWMAIAGGDAPRGFYHVPLPAADKAIESVPAKHRGRARKRRELRKLLRDEIASQLRRRLAADCLAP